MQSLKPGLITFQVTGAFKLRVNCVELVQPCLENLVLHGRCPGGSAVDGDVARLDDVEAVAHLALAEDDVALGVAVHELTPFESKF
jgi:hypothetical protein